MEKYIQPEQKYLSSLQNSLLRYATLLMEMPIPTPLTILLLFIESLQIIAMGLVSPLHYSSMGLNTFTKLATALYPDSYLR